MHKLNSEIICYLMGVLLLFNGGFMLLSTLVSVLTEDGKSLELTLSALLTLLVGIILMLISRNHTKQINKREGYLIVSFGWLLMTISGMLPYLMTDVFTDVPSAFFETMSGYTTTGSSVLSDIETLPKGVLFWRSTTHWIGGMGIIVLAIAILPLLGIGGMQLFTAEAPGPSSDKLHPRITDTAKRLWYIYVGFTVVETLLLWSAGMGIFDAITHAMSTVSTGGFSTKNASIAHWNHQPIIQYIITVFMFIAGVNFIVSYFAFTGQIKKIIKDEEFRYFMLMVLGCTIVVATILYVDVDLSSSRFVHPEVWGKAESSLRHALFQVVAVITTTGFVTADFTSWTPFLTLLFFGLMFLGGSAGSTSGGIKGVRHYLMIKSGLLEFNRALHPNAVLQIRYNQSVVQDNVVQNIYGFFILYMLSFIIGALGFSLLGLDFVSAIGVAASSLGNVGPALGDFGPSFTFYAMSSAGKCWASFLMLLGRLELFTVMILFTRFFWKKI
ncbi:MAG: TrkH family potassium uptake protein [Flavobacteriaceae bacterium]